MLKMNYPQNILNLKFKEEYLGQNNLSFLRMIKIRAIENNIDPMIIIHHAFNEIENSNKLSDKNIHCIYYCCRGSRLYEPERIIIKELKKIKNLYL